MVNRSFILGCFALAVVLSQPAVRAQEQDHASVSNLDSTTATVPMASVAHTVAKLSKEQIGSISPLHTCGEFLLAGQPTPEDLNLLKERGIKTIISVRKESEISWSESVAVQALGMQYVHVPFRNEEELTEKVFASILEVLRDEKRQPVMFHCGSANRVGAVWFAFRRLDAGLPEEEALAEAKAVGLRNSALLDLAKEYVAHVEAQQASVVTPPLPD